ncbi:tRNA (N(6)-L-threonylcarbamoyladenosine(37)-C(2))-methylthiotransferase MtaB [Pontixanthobacter gangjinensis]|uniref:MiaB/RimO family radical SAM methylthiotransferase n=1 Tax=Pontixanthobacter gangjinensis TaxID=1028742 RepID=A0A6I4SNI2_9SPHN|nr:MiaB/RimO family radical SAM methylthiotransferase [Pontixanthobacter gangjinensis]MXO57323.1 MiaB/RimO family radical SAM methylthiotransferase [Pontixanthobacter gangjinensis]
MTASNGAEVITLGCRLNISESEQIKSMLAEDDNIVVINSCAVTSEAVRQTRQAIRKARRARPDARLLVTGCAADIERDQLGTMPEVDGLIANTAKLDPRAWNIPAGPNPVVASRTRAFITVQNGCDHACTFCVIPQGRGKSRSTTITQILEQVGKHLEHGAPEIVLTGVDVTSWGHDLPNTPTLGSMVAAVLNNFPELQRLRMSSLDGIEIDPLLEDLLANEQRLMPHLHLSLQHGHDMILKRMKRRHLRHDAVALVQRLKAKRPDIAIGADLIAGFPTEDDAMHHANRSIIGELDIVHGHIFPYSPRPNTPAARMPQIDRSIIKARAAELRADVAERRSTWLQSLVGEALPILAERDGTGYAPNFARVAVPEGIAPGRIVTLTPTGIDKGLLR